MRALRRLAIWGGAAAVALTMAVLSAQRPAPVAAAEASGLAAGAAMPER